MGQGNGDIAALLARAAVHHRQGEPDKAETLYREVLEREPRHAQALYLAGTLKAQARDLLAARDYLDRALDASPEHVPALINCGNVLLQLGEHAAAAARYARVLELDADNADACLGLGRVEFERGNDAGADDYLAQALAARPAFAQAEFQLGRLHRRRGLLEAALECYEKTLRMAPGMLHVYRELGGTLQRLGRPLDSLDAWEKYVSAFPDEAGGWNNLGNVQRQLARLDAAAGSYRRALALDPAQAEISNNLGNVLKTLGQFDEALACYRQAIRLNPEFVQAHSNLVLCMNYVPGMDEQQLYNEHLCCAATYIHSSSAQTAFENSREPERRLRIGYMSPDFRTHAVSCFFEPLLASHDHERFEITLYAQLLKGDETTARLQSASDGWCATVGMSHEALAARIRADGIDILVDLAGHSARNRLPVMALRPAPVQVSWLGYPNTTGLGEVDYRLSDAIADPPGQTALYTETLLYLESGLTCYRPPQYAPECGPLPALESGHITFGSLNNLVKLNDEVIALWSRVLQAVPGARLRLYRDMLKGVIAERIRAAFAAQGIASERIELLHSLPDADSYLGAYGGIDIALDPWPWNGHVTTCESLWMGVPVIALRGPVQRGRLAASVLHQVGLARLVAADADGYIEIARELAGDPAQLASLRQNLRDQVAESSLCNGDEHARSVERAYREGWRRWCEARPVKSV